MSEQAQAVPLVEALLSVPKNAHGWVTEDDPLKSSRHIPYGRYCHEAAGRIIELEEGRTTDWIAINQGLHKRIAELEAQVARMPVVAGYVTEDFAKMVGAQYVCPQPQLIAKIKQQHFKHPIYIFPPEEKGE